MSTLTQIANQLKDNKENIILIYAFNTTGKTLLSVEYKNISKSEDGDHVGVYYNAYSEDLFIWNNDDANDNANIELTIEHSSLNDFHSLLTEDAIRQKLIPYNPKYDFKFNIEGSSPDLGIESISFFIKGNEDVSIKISRGEERIFVLCFFLTLFDVEGIASKQKEHFFIDDPVSSLDDHNIYVTAYTIYDLIEREFEKRKIIITSHHFGFLTIISDMLGKGVNAGKFRNRDNSKKYKEFILESTGNELSLVNTKDGVFLYHLRLLQILEQASKTEVYTFHFALLRQVLENIASFLGVGQFSYVLTRIGISDEQRVAFIVNALSHLNVYYQQIDKPVPDNLKMFNEILEKIKTTYMFKIPVNS